MEADRRGYRTGLGFNLCVAPTHEHGLPRFDDRGGRRGNGGGDEGELATGRSEAQLEGEVRVKQDS